MCEFVRAAFAANKFPQMGSITNMKKDFISKMTCLNYSPVENVFVTKRLAYKQTGGQTALVCQ